MKALSFILIALLSLSLFASDSFAKSRSYGGSSYVRGYTKKNGTYVQPHYRTSPNRTKLDNYSTKGNTNPYTRKEGTKDPYRFDQQQQQQ